MHTVIRSVASPAWRALAPAARDAPISRESRGWRMPNRDRSKSTRAARRSANPRRPTASSPSHRPSVWLSPMATWRVYRLYPSRTNLRLTADEPGAFVAWPWLDRRRVNGVQPRADFRGGGGGQPRPGLHRVRRPAIQFRPDRRARPPIRPGAAHVGAWGAAERFGVGAARVGAEPSRAVPGELQRIPRSHARCVPGPGCPVQRQLSLCRRRTGVPAG